MMKDLWNQNTKIFMTTLKKQPNQSSASFTTVPPHSFYFDWPRQKAVLSFRNFSPSLLSSQYTFEGYLLLPFSL